MNVGNMANLAHSTRRPSYGEELVNRISAEGKNEIKAVQRLSEQEDLVLKTFRLLVADLC